MASFTDGNGNVWDITITAPLVERINKELGIQLFERSPNGEVKVERLYMLRNDPVGVVMVAEYATRKQRETKNISPEEFGESLHGEFVSDAHRCIVDAVIDFFPQGSRSKLIALDQELEQAVKNDIEGVKLLNDPDVTEKLKEVQKRQLLDSLERLESATN